MLKRLGIFVLVVGWPSQLQLLLALHASLEWNVPQSFMSQRCVSPFHLHPSGESLHPLADR